MITQTEIERIKEDIKYAKKRICNTTWEKDLRDKYIKMKEKRLEDDI